MQRWLINTLQHLDHHQPIASQPTTFAEDEIVEEQQGTTQQNDEEVPPSGIGQHTAATKEQIRVSQNKMPLKQVPRQKGVTLWGAKTTQCPIQDQQQPGG